MNAQLQTPTVDLTPIAQKVLKCERQDLSPCDEPYLMALVELGDQAQQIVTLQETLRGLTQIVQALDHRYSHFEVNGVECDEDYPKLKDALSQFVKSGTLPSEALAIAGAA